MKVYVWANASVRHILGTIRQREEGAGPNRQSVHLHVFWLLC